MLVTPCVYIIKQTRVINILIYVLFLDGDKFFQENDQHSHSIKNKYHIPYYFPTSVQFVAHTIYIYLKFFTNKFRIT